MPLLADLLRDFCYSARALLRTPGLTVVAVVVLALGIGANSAIFSLVSAVWLKPLSFADAERLTGLRATPNLFDEKFWLRRLTGDPAAVGRTIDLDGSPHMVVGVVPRDFLLPEGDNDVFIPTAFAPDVLARYQSYYWYIVAKLRTGVELDAANAELRATGISPVMALRAQS
jgi:hypothetical protein